MRVQRFGHGIAFAAIAAALAVAAQATLGPRCGHATTLGCTLGALAVAWLFAIARDPAQGLRVALVAAPAAAVIVAIAPHIGFAAIGLTLLIGLARGAFLHRGPAARTVLIEVALGACALGAAAWLAPGRGLLGLGLAVWGFFLIESLALLIARGPAAPDGKATDAFTAAHARVERLLEG